MKNIYLVQANAVYGDKVKSTYIPYAIGCLAAFAFSDERIKKEYSLGKFIYTRTDIEKASKAMESPYLIGFSSSIWNNEYNKALAKKCKELYPDCIIVFGGHQVPPDGEKAFEEYKDADIIIHGGGEEAFRDILLCLSQGKDLGEINNISVRLADGSVINGEKKNPDTPDYPSPYLTGIFDPILSDGLEFSAIIETNRGCPNRCAFCDWGILRSKVRQFSLEKVYKELQWLSEHKVEYVYCADANFGLFDRDMDITDEFIRLKNETGYPSKLKVNFTKNRCDFVGEISRKLSENGMGKSQTLSFQSVDEKVLAAIGRKNIDLSYFRQLLVMYAKAGIPTYSELILGLPEETYESFISGICTLIENGQHKSINVYPCELLPNSQLGSGEFVEKYKISTARLPFLQFHCEKTTGDIIEYSNLIISTSTMSREEWVDSYFFATLIQSFHCLDIIRETAIYLRYTRGIEFVDFYAGLRDFSLSRKGSYLSNVFSSMREHLDKVSLSESSIGIYDSRFGKISYEPDENMFLSAVYDSNALYSQLLEYICTLTDRDTAEMLISYQKAILNLPQKEDFSEEFPVDLPAFFSAFEKGESIEPAKKNTLISFYSPHKASSWEEYARECVWYGRRNEGMHMRAVSEK